MTDSVGRLANWAILRRMSASVPDAIAHRVCGTIMIRLTWSNCTLSTHPVRTSAETRPPGERRILASPSLSPSMRSGSIRESMQVTSATPAFAMPSK